MTRRLEGAPSHREWATAQTAWCGRVRLLFAGRPSEKWLSLVVNLLKLDEAGRGLLAAVPWAWLLLTSVC